jgi:protein ImuB
VNTLVAVAREFSPRYERHRDNLVSIDVSGLDRLIGPPATIGEELRREVVARGVRVHVALARTRAAALVLALARPGVTVIDAGRERDALAPLPIAILEKAHGSWLMTHGPAPLALSLEPLKRWGIRTLGEFAALPPADLSSRLGQQALAWQAIARGEDTAPLVPALPEERFESSLDLEWPVEDLEPMSFVLTRLLEPLSVRLERRDRGAAVLHLELRLITHSLGADAVSTDRYDRHLQLPSPIRDVRTLRTLLLLDLESHPPPAAVDRVTILIDPTPGRVVQHTLFTRAHPTPEQLSTLLARLGALLGQDRIGAPATLDSHRPGAFRMDPFATEHPSTSLRAGEAPRPKPPIPSPQPLVSALRRCRQPVPARAVIEDGRPTRLTTDRRGFAGGRVLTGTGPWRTSGNWWAGRAGGAGTQKHSEEGSVPPIQPLPPFPPSWDRDEWDVALADGAVYRVFRNRETDGWFIEAIVD